MATETLFLINPRKRRKAKRARKGVSVMAKRRRRSRKTSYRRNPISLGGLAPLFMRSATGAAGALAVNGIVSNAPLPDAMRTGNMIHLTKAAFAFVLNSFGPRLPIIGRYARDMAQGSLTVTLADFGRQMAAQQGVNLSGIGYVSPAAIVNRNLPYNAGSLSNKFARMGEYVSNKVTPMRVNGMGQYVRGVRGR